MSVVWLVTLLSAAPESGDWLYRSAHSEPFGSYSDWRSFMERAPDPPEGPAVLEGYIDRESFDACFAVSPGRELGAHSIRREWITYMSDGLRVRALLVRPAYAEKNAQPLMVYLHGGVARWGKITSLTLLHGDSDRWVPVEDSQRMADALRSIGRSVELLVPNAGHSLRVRWPWVRRRVEDILERALGRRAGRNPTTRTQGEGATPDHSEAKP